ncbi:MAG: ribulokinase [Planctomycetota bacterium]|jgi:L-ribulokinase
MAKHAIGVDFGTNSVRALVVDCETGAELGTAVHNYEHGEDGIILDPADPNLARQHPRDYVTGLEAAITGAMKEAAGAGASAKTVIGIGVDTTGSTPLPVAEDGTPLAFKDEFRDNPNAMAWLWKDHTAHEEAAAITAKAGEMRPQFLARCGGTYSSEWWWSKIWRCMKADRKVFDAAHSWVECADFVPAWLAGDLDPSTMKRGVCPAGHKAMYAADLGGLPDEEFLKELTPELAELRCRLYDVAYTADIGAGALSSENAKRLGLTVGTPIAVGAFDAHTGGVGAGIRPGVFVKVIGTSTCDMAVQPNDGAFPEITGLCGIVDGSILPNYYGFEAGQSAVGDIFNWFVRFSGKSHEELTAGAEKLAVGESGLVALDWNNGNRTVLVDPNLSGLVTGLTLHTRPEEVYRALVEGTAFGARVIVERLVEGGVPVDEVICCGGIAEKNPMLMQIYADVIGKPMKISRSAQTCALGSAVFGAVVGGAHFDAETAQGAMTGIKDESYEPTPEGSAAYEEIYKVYRTLHDSFGLPGERDLSRVMKDLIAIRAKAKATNA